MRRKNMSRRCIVLGLAAAFLGCPPHEDYTPLIEISPNAAARGCLIPSHCAPAAEPPKAARATVHVLRPGEELGGPNAVGRPGDLILQNDEVAFVIDQLGSSAGFAESGGNLVDAADAKVRKDELGQIFSYFGTFPRQGVYTEISSREAPDGSATVTAVGRELYEPQLRVTTVYALQPADRALLLTTTLENRSDHPVDGLALGDAVQWGGAEKFAPGKAVGFRGDSKGPFVGAIGTFTSYAITSTEGEIACQSGGSWTDTFQSKLARLAPRKSVTYTRVFVVGERPDSSSVVSELIRAGGGDVGHVALKLQDANGAPLPVAVGSKAVFSGEGGGDLFSLVATAVGPSFEGDVPLGKLRVRFEGGGGRRGLGDPLPITVGKGSVATATLPASSAAAASFSCVQAGAREPSPCKITVEGTGGTKTPDFGPAPNAVARNQVNTATGLARVPLSPGSYRFTASRGTEYEPVVREAIIADAGLYEGTFELSRVVDTSGYVAADFHQHTMLGADAPVSTESRVVSNVAAGLEVAVSTEHNTVVDLSQVAKRLGVDKHIVHLSGVEITSDASRAPFGHLNVFPLPVFPHKPRGGAPVVRDRLASDLFTEMLARAERPIVQVNHPRSGKTGYFELLAFDPQRGVGTGPGYDARFDVLEVWNGHAAEERDRVLEDYLSLLRTGHPVTPTANTDTHGVVGQEPGLPRTYVRMDDNRVAGWDAARTAALVTSLRSVRDVVLTDGPFLRVTTEAAGSKPKSPGAVVSGKRVRVRVHVECTNNAKVDQVELRFASGAKAISKPVVLRELARKGEGAFLMKVLAADLVFDVAPAADDAFVVVGRGAQTLAPLAASPIGDMPVFAMTSATFLDADGDKKSLGL